MNGLKFFMKLVTFVIFTQAASFAQQSTVASGGNIAGNGGSISYSVGQVAYETITSQSYSIAQGVQQPYEIFSTDVEDLFDDFETMVYPNPATDMVNVRISEIYFRKPDFRLLDINGKELKNGSLSQRETSIPFSSYPSGTYVLLISENGKALRSFKIIKH